MRSARLVQNLPAVEFIQTLDTGHWTRRSRPFAVGATERRCRAYLYLWWLDGPYGGGGIDKRQIHPSGGNYRSAQQRASFSAEASAQGVLEPPKVAP